MLMKHAHDGTVATIHGDDETKTTGSRYYLHARNMADAVIFILSQKVDMYPNSDRPSRYNIVGDQEVTNLEMANIVSELMGKKIEYKIINFHSSRPGHDKRYALDGGKLRGMGWRAPKSFRESLKETIDWTLAHPLWF